MKKHIILLSAFILIAFITSSQSLDFIKSDQVFEPARTNTIALADLDNDGDLDAIFANMGFIDSKILLNNGNGVFAPTNQKLTQQGHGIGIADLDNDGDLDLVMTCAGWSADESGYTNRPTKIYFNNGKGYFIDSGQNLGDSLDSGSGLTLTDIDMDGDLDLHVNYYDSDRRTNYHKIYLNAGLGQFILSNIEFEEGYSIFWNDLDNDKDIDAFIRITGKGFKTMINDGKGNFKDYWVTQVPDLPRGTVGLIDIDLDNDLDAIVTHGSTQQPKPTQILINDGTGSFSDSGKELQVLMAGSKFLFGDLNNDGFNDAYIKNFRYPNYIWLGDGAGNMKPTDIELCEGEPNGNCAIGDLDGDGDLDIFNSFFFGLGNNTVWFNTLKKYKFN